MINIYVLCYLLQFLLLPCAIQPLAAIHEFNKTFIELNWIELNWIIELTQKCTYGAVLIAFLARGNVKLI